MSDTLAYFQQLNPDKNRYAFRKRSENWDLWFIF